MSVKLAIIYYSSTGTNYQLATWAAEAAKEAGAEVKILKVKETTPAEVIEGNEKWKRTVEKTKEIAEVALEDLEWADAFIFSTPTRYGNVPSQFQDRKSVV